MLDEAIGRARTLLPEQGPIDVFVHHNTLHHFEDMKFEDATEAVSGRIGSQPYMAHGRYFDEFLQGRITPDSLLRAIQHNLEQAVLPARVPDLGVSAHRFLEKVILTSKIEERAETVAHLIYRNGFLKGFSAHTSEFSRDRIREAAIANYRQTATSQKELLNGQLDEYALTRLWNSISSVVISTDRHRQPAGTTKVLDELVNKRLITFLNAYSDQGIAYWPMPTITSSLLGSFLSFIKHGERLVPSHVCWVLEEDVAAVKSDLDTAVEVLLSRLEVPNNAKSAFVESELLKLPGWSGTVGLFEGNPHLLSKKRAYSLKELLVVRLLLLRKLRNYGGYFHTSDSEPSENDLAASLKLEIFFLCQALGIGEFDASQTAGTVKIVEEVNDFTRRRILHQAYEASYRDVVMDAVAVNRTRIPSPTAPPLYQAMFCIDDREESLRRHLEEVQPECETFGVAGFFGLNILFKGVQDAHAAALCPVNVKAEHLVEEEPAAASAGRFRQAERRSRLLKGFLRRTYDQSRDFFGGALVTIVGGILSCLPMMLLIHFPRLSGFLVQKLKDHFFPEFETKLNLATPSEELDFDADIKRGFTDKEMAEKVFGLLTTVGVQKFSKLVFVIGHGSSSLNNPHESAHDCGACGGRRGGPNARAFSQIVNRPSVRELLKAKGMMIPSSTYFVGGYHNTCSDGIEYFDTGLIPDDLIGAFQKAVADFDRARKFDAHERCRRFEDACHLGPSLALKHVEARAQNLREPRPEYGHCTNSICIIGRRELTKNLFLDRRAFVISYDASTDASADILVNLLSAVIPVCAGINLEYYFSFVDNEKYGCGTKLPHNITGLIGVMNGGLSDLRTGLPWQMVEIHEPVRLVTIVESTQTQMRMVLEEADYVRKLVDNKWILLGGICPETGRSWWVEEGDFVEHEARVSSLPEFSNSKAYYQGRLEHLNPALITHRG